MRDDPNAIHLPRLYAKQKAAFFNPARTTIIEASTKAGKSVGALVWLLYWMIEKAPAKSGLWVAPVYPQAKVMYRRLCRYLTRADPMMRRWSKHDAELYITVPNGGTIWFKGSDNPDSIYGSDYAAAVVDEASRCRPEAYYAVESTLTATGGPIRIIGNVKGRANWAYQLGQKAQQGETGLSYHKITAMDAVEAGVLKAEVVEDARAKLPKAVFEELFLCKPADDGGNPFGMQYIRQCVMPLSEGEPVVFGVDLARASDFTVVIGLDGDGRTCRFDRWQGLSWEHTGNRIASIIGGVRGMVDSTGVGDVVVERLQRRLPRIEPYHFSSKSKQALMESLAVSIQNTQIGYPDGEIVRELESFEYEYTRTGVQYCMHPNTRILTSDLRWIPCGEVKPGDGLIGFDEEAPTKKSRCWRSTTAVDVKRLVRPCYRISMDDGVELVVSQDHKWLVNVGGKTVWRRTDELKAKHPTSKSLRFSRTRIVKLLDVWNTANDRSGGYLAAAFDGEGCLNQTKRNDHTGSNFRLSFAQKDNQMLAAVKQHLNEYGFKWSVHKSGRGMSHVNITGRRGEVVRFLGQVRPLRLLAKFDANRLGSVNAMGLVGVSSLEFIGDHEVVAIETGTHTLVAEGLASHNCAPSGLHDDCVCALALAALKHERQAFKSTAYVGVLGSGVDEHFGEDDDPTQDDERFWS